MVFSREGEPDVVGNHEEMESSKRILSSLSISKLGESGGDLLRTGSGVSRAELKSNDFCALKIVGEPWEKAIWRDILPLRRGSAVGDIGVRTPRAFGEPVASVDDERDGGVWNWSLVRRSRPRE